MTLSNLSPRLDFITLTCLGGKLPSHKQSAYAISNAIADYDDGSDCTLCNARVTNYFTILCTI